MKAKEVQEFRKTMSQLEGLYQEVSASAKKAPDKAVSSFKIEIVNQILGRADGVLGPSAPFGTFGGFNTDDLPTNSDVSLVLAQYMECAEKMRCENISKSYDGAWYWRIDGALSAIVTSAPRSI